MEWLELGKALTCNQPQLKDPEQANQVFTLLERIGVLGEEREGQGQEKQGEQQHCRERHCPGLRMAERAGAGESGL